ncbi:hypothetical protein ACIFOC_00088 [Leucobacter aridicollis]|nr:hypothetical protein [Leucobacter aridicollis]
MPRYESPSIVEVGKFSEVTRLTRLGNWVDSPGWGYWF